MLNRNGNEEMAAREIANKAQVIVGGLSKSIVNITFDEMKRCEEQKNKMTDIFYNKINILNAICSALLSGNLLLFVYFAEKPRFINDIFPATVYGVSTVVIVIVMIMLLSNMRFRKEYYEINEVKYVETLSKLNSEEMVKRTNIAAIITKNYQKNKNLEKLKSKLKHVTILISISIILAILGSAYMIVTKDKENSAVKVEVIKTPEMKLYYQSGAYP